ncbi:MAG: tRNA U34 5-methylaminomethyl-2-thiouridine-forming methyltransferase MnmC [Limisphaerales bacterium]|jgi:tRNA U34 5-methylaminomethyl-2-thiouridine-forming methyltransferase MnmC
MLTMTRMTDDYHIVSLPGGKCSVGSRSVGEVMHPDVGPSAEAFNLYVEQPRLRERVVATEGAFVIWDVGIGAGANILVALQNISDIPAELEIVSFDHSDAPLRFALEHARELNYFGELESSVAELLEHRTLDLKVGKLSVQWRLVIADFPALLNGDSRSDYPSPHAIFHDAWSPKKNSQMWSGELFEKLFQSVGEGQDCVLSTYSRATVIRTALLLAGFYVGRGVGIGVKEETTQAATRMELLAEPLGRDWFGRAQRSHAAEPFEITFRQAPLSKRSLERFRKHPQFV